MGYVVKVILCDTITSLDLVLFPRGGVSDSAKNIKVRYDSAN
jgi:hypothetical protein